MKRSFYPSSSVGKKTRARKPDGENQSKILKMELLILKKNAYVAGKFVFVDNFIEQILGITENFTVLKSNFTKLSKFRFLYAVNIQYFLDLFMKEIVLYQI